MQVCREDNILLYRWPNGYEVILYPETLKAPAKINTK